LGACYCFMTSSISNIALSGLKAAQSALTVTSNNIANQNTAGYSRQTLVQQSAFSIFSGNTYYGQGVDVIKVERVYNEFLSSQSIQAASRFNHLQTYSNQMDQLINGIGSVETGINQSLNGLYQALSDFSQRTSDTAARQSALSSLSSTASRFRAISESLSDLAHGANQQISATVGQMNELMANLADYNHRISVAVAGNNGSLPNDLLDQRDSLINQLGQLTGITTSRQGNAINVYMSSGQPLVVGGIASKLEFAEDSASSSGYSLSLVTRGTNVLLRDKDLQGGAIGALVSFRDNELKQAQADLGRLAIALASAYNQQQQFGLDAKGNPGAQVFDLGLPVAIDDRANTGDALLSLSFSDIRSLTGSNYELRRDGNDYVMTRLDDNTVVGTFSSLPQSVDGLNIALRDGDLNDGDVFIIDVSKQAAGGLSMLLTEASQLAGAAPMSVGADAANAGTGVVDRLRSVESGAQDFTQEVSVVFTSGNAYELRDSANQVLGAGTIQPGSNTIAHNGWAFELTGSPVAGDRFVVSPDAGDPSGDNRNALALATLGTARLLNGGTLTDAYAASVSSIGARASTVAVGLEAQKTAYESAVAAQESVSGVNLEEEGALLIKYQQAYSAAGKVLSVAQGLFDELLTAIR